MATRFLSLTEPAPPGFETGQPRKRELLAGAVALYAPTLAAAEALLPDFRARVHGVVVLPGPQYASARLGEALWQLGVPAEWRPRLRELLELPLALVAEAEASRASLVEQALSIARMRSELGLTREDYNRVTARLQQQVNELEAMQETLRRQLDEQRRAQEALAVSEANLRRLADDLQRSNTDLQRFAYVASHDLQEPLRAVAGCVRLLQQIYAPRLDQRGDELISHAVDGAVRMQNLINDLLAFSRVESRGKPLTPVAMDKVVHAALANLSAARQESGARIYLAPALPTVQGDESQLVQLLQNLVGNAIKYRGPRVPEIRIEFREGPEAFEFAVSDNGIGIAPAYFDKIFVIFQRLHTREEYPGTGVGLAICQRVVDRHQGRIWVESVPGAGSTFRFTLLK